MKQTIHCKYDELLALTAFRPHPKNRNKHPQKQVERLASLYSSHGIRHPIIVSKKSGFVVVGHCRLAAAVHLNMPTFPVVYQDFTTDAQEYEFLHADNAIASWAELDIGEIKFDLQGIEGISIENLSIEGLTDVTNHARLKDLNALNEVKKPVKAEKKRMCFVWPSEIWSMGAHKLEVSQRAEDCPEAQKILETYQSSKENAPVFLLSDEKMISIDDIRTKRLEVKIRKAGAA